MKSFVFDLQRFQNISVYKNNTLITGTNYADSIYSNGYSSVTVNALGGNDTVSVDGGGRISISGGSGNDSVFTHSNYTTVSGGDGNDTIRNNTYYSSINGGAGDDSLYNYSYGSTIRGGSGDDKISLYSAATGNVIQYSNGDGRYDLRLDINQQNFSAERILLHARNCRFQRRLRRGIGRSDSRRRERQND